MGFKKLEPPMLVKRFHLRTCDNCTKELEKYNTEAQSIDEISVLYSILKSDSINDSNYDFTCCSISCIIELLEKNKSWF